MEIQKTTRFLKILSKLLFVKVYNVNLKALLNKLIYVVLLYSYTKQSYFQSKWIVDCSK